jgi:1-acyl-sn-glycerol-3-phosphate acyltransferase
MRMNKAQKMVYLFLKFLISLILSKIGSWKVSGIEYVPNDGPLIFVMNHIHRLDGAIVMAALPRVVSLILAYDVIRGHPFLSALVRILGRSVGAVVIDRHQGPKFAAMKIARSRLKTGRCILIAPEGTRGSGQELGAFHDGAAFLALATGAKIVPVVTFGYSGNSFRGVLFSKSITVIVGKPFNLARQLYTHTYTRQMGTQEIRERIQNLLLEHPGTI